jgi:hypothetical protein
MSVCKFYIGITLVLVECGDLNVQPATPPRAQLQWSPEIDALTKRAQAIYTVGSTLNIMGCSNGPADPPVCQRNLMPRVLANRATKQLQFGPPADVEGRVKGAAETLHQAEQALVAARGVSGADCQGKTGPDRALAYQDTCAAVERVRAIVQSNDQAVQLDGDPYAQKVRLLVAMCTDDRQTCFTRAKDLGSKSKTGVLAGEAELLVHQTVTQIAGWSRGVSPYNPPLVVPSDDDLAQAETLAKQAKDAVQQAVDARAAAAAAEQANAQKEKDAVDAAQNACGLNPSLCKSKCDAGDTAACEYWGNFQLKPGGSTAVGRAALVKACDTGSMPNACAQVRGLDAMLQRQAAQIDSLWNAVVEVGDDLAQKRHVATVFAQVATRPSQQRNLQQLQAFNAATVTERYCPARKAFLQASSVAEFQRRAGAHCKDLPPTGQGLSGAQVTLTTECQQVYATACP